MDESRWCFAWFGDEDDDTAARSRAAAARRYLWDRGAEIYVAYQEDGDAEEDADLRALVERYAVEWMDFANVTITFIDDPEQADIRISFRYAGCWSTVGTACRTQSRSRPTMNFNARRLRRIDDDKVRGVVLHEFGHALGLIHEHQQPSTPLQFDRQKVLAEVSGPPNHWTEAQIERNIFAPAAAGETNATEYDRDSIMMYPIPARWLLNPAEETEENFDLSPRDRSFVGTQYPRPVQP